MTFPLNLIFCPTSTSYYISTLPISAILVRPSFLWAGYETGNTPTLPCVKTKTKNKYVLFVGYSNHPWAKCEIKIIHSEFPPFYLWKSVTFGKLLIDLSLCFLFEKWVTFKVCIRNSVCTGPSAVSDKLCVLKRLVVLKQKDAGKVWLQTPLISIKKFIWPKHYLKFKNKKLGKPGGHALVKKCQTSTKQKYLALEYPFLSFHYWAVTIPRWAVPQENGKSSQNHHPLGRSEVVCEGLSMGMHQS